MLTFTLLRVESQFLDCGGDKKPMEEEHLKMRVSFTAGSPYELAGYELHWED